MAFAIDKREKLGTGIRRALIGQIDQAISDLTSSDMDPHEGVHDARTRCKRIRAILRLLRPRLKKQYQVENEWFRDTARLLATARDAAAIMEAFDKLVLVNRESNAPARFAPIRKGLYERRETITTHGGPTDHGEVLDGFHQARARIMGWDFGVKGWAIVKPGLQAMYAQSQDYLERVIATRETTIFHEWRKPVKYFWYQTELLRRVVPAFDKKFRKSLRDLAELIGDDHDLYVLQLTMRTESYIYGPEQLQTEFLGLMHERRLDLQDAAVELGEQLFPEKPERFVKKLNK